MSRKAQRSWPVLRCVCFCFSFSDTVSAYLASGSCLGDTGWQAHAVGRSPTVGMILFSPQQGAPFVSTQLEAMNCWCVWMAIIVPGHAAPSMVRQCASLDLRTVESAGRPVRGVERMVGCICCILILACHRFWSASCASRIQSLSMLYSILYILFPDVKLRQT